MAFGILSLLVTVNCIPGAHGQGFASYIAAALGGATLGFEELSGFELPKIYLETVPNKAEAQPRVVVVFHLFHKLPEKEKSKYGPKPLPELGETMPADRFKETFNARLVIKGFSKPKDPKSVDYDAALMQVQAEIVNGPMKGTQVGLRFEAMYKGNLSRIFNKRSRTLDRLVGVEMNMRLTPWKLLGFIELLFSIQTTGYLHRGVPSFVSNAIAWRLFCSLRPPPLVLRAPLASDDCARLSALMERRITDHG